MNMRRLMLCVAGMKCVFLVQKARKKKSSTSNETASNKNRKDQNVVSQATISTAYHRHKI